MVAFSRTKKETLIDSRGDCFGDPRGEVVIGHAAVTIGITGVNSFIAVAFIGAAAGYACSGDGDREGQHEHRGQGHCHQFAFNF